jgi:hypothetical protein
MNPLFLGFHALAVSADMNGDGAVTITDAWLWVKWFFWLPGNFLLEILGRLPKFAAFFDIHASPSLGYESFYGLVAGCVSLVFWWLIWHLIDRIAHVGTNRVTSQ